MSDMTITRRYARWEAVPKAALEIGVLDRAKDITTRVADDLERYLAEHHLRRVSDIEIVTADQDPWSDHDGTFTYHSGALGMVAFLAEAKAAGMPPEQPPKNWRERLRRFVSAP